MVPSSLPEHIGPRYRVQRRLGRGGMAAVYEVADLSTGTLVALKQLLPVDDPKRARQSELLLEREFQTLAELSHPRVIAVYDYGIESGQAYYTMELLDGGDLRERVPLPWRAACTLAFEVCSSLALLHARRLIHRDVSPRNIRCTRNGAAKLIDFGAMVPMGQGRHAVGTPAFVAPEVLHRSTLDARTDLFSLGATLYHALTGRMAYAAREFEHLVDAWAQKPAPPSRSVPEVPAALDALVMSLLSLDPASRPRSAFEVMERLSAITGDVSVEPESVRQAYLSTPILVGRGGASAALRAAITRMIGGRGDSIAFHGAAGVGRSRMLDACMLETKTQSASVLCARAADLRPLPFATAQTLAEQLLVSHPKAARTAAADEGVQHLLLTRVCDGGGRFGLRPLIESQLPQAELLSALAQMMLRAARERPLLIAVDDVQRVDDASAALLLLLADGARSTKLLLALTRDTEQTTTPAAIAGLLGRSNAIELQPLSRHEEAELLSSVFGDVPNLSRVSSWIHAVSRGNPRTCMDLAQHLVDKGVVTYHGGSWTLPNDLDAIELPGTVEEIVQQRIGRLSPLARMLAQTHALALDDALEREQYETLAGGVHAGWRVEQALSELTAQQIAVDTGEHHVLVSRDIRSSLLADIDAHERAQRHLALVQLYAGDDVAEVMRAAHHLLEAGQGEAALQRLIPALASLPERHPLVGAAKLRGEQVACLLERAVDFVAAGAGPGKPLALAVLRQRLITVAGVTDVDVYYRAAPGWQAQLELDSGLRFYRELSEVADPAQRLMTAIARAGERFAATPKADRVYRPDAAIRNLVGFVASALQAGANTFDGDLLAPLADVVTPFAALSPLIECVRDNATATWCAIGSCRFDRAIALWQRSFQRLSEPAVAGLPNSQPIRGGVAWAVGVLEARVGLLESAGRWADVLDGDPLQKVNALTLRRIIRLQLGDWDGAEKLRKRAEVVAAQNNVLMFFNALSIELAVAALADDLTLLRRAMTRIAKLAAVRPGWVQFDLLAQGHFHRSCGEFEAALEALERCLALTMPDGDPERGMAAAWPTAAAACIDTLVALGRHEEAEARGQRALAICEQYALHLASPQIARALALAEAKLGRHAEGAARLEDLADRQAQLGMSGVQLGATYEARARVAIWCADKVAIERFGALAAQEYRHGHGSALGARYERLLDEAHDAGVKLLPDLGQIAPTMVPGTSGSRFAPTLGVDRALREAGTRDERAHYALSLLCDKFGARAGYLYLYESTGLRLAASQAAKPASAEVLELVRAELARDLDDDNLATRAMREGTDETDSQACWTDESGVVFRPVVLSCSIDGRTLHAGAAALAVLPRRRRRDLSAVTAAVATGLIRAGDCEVRSDDAG